MMDALGLNEVCPLQSAEAPFFASVEIVPYCNGRCEYCRSWRRKRSEEVISVAACEPLLPDLYKLGVRKLVLTGGEPLLHPRLADIVALVFGTRLHTSIVANGVPLREPLLTRLLDAGLLGLTVSADSLDPDTYRSIRGIPLETILPAIDLLGELARRDDGFAASVNCVMTALNHDQIPRLVEEFAEQGIPISIQPCNTDGEDDWAWLVPSPDDYPAVARTIDQLVTMKEEGAPILDSVEFLLQILEFWTHGRVPSVSGCHYGDATVTINSKGEVLPCRRLASIGSIHDASIRAIRGTPQFAEQQRRMHQGACPGCWLVCSFDWRSLWHSEQEVTELWGSR